MDFSHFKADVPSNIKRHLLAVAEAIKSDYIGELSHHRDSYGGRDIEPISGNSYDGFIALQSGGYSISEFYSHGSNSGSYFTEGEEDQGNKDIQQAFKDYLEDKNLSLDMLWDDLSADQREEVSELEQEYLEPTLVNVSLWVDDDSETIQLFLSINYKDAPYYRGMYEETLVDKVYTFEEFLNTSPQEIVNLLQEIL